MNKVINIKDYTDKKVQNVKLRKQAQKLERAIYITNQKLKTLNSKLKLLIREIEGKK